MISVFVPGEDQKDLAGRLNAKLKNTNVVLRAPRIGTKLKFDIDGKSVNAEGIRGFDDEVEITRVRLINNELVLNGVRLHDSYKARNKSVRTAEIDELLEIRVTLADSGSESAILQSFDKVFKTKTEAESSCSDYSYVPESFARKPKVRLVKGKPEQDPPVERQLREVCFPSGARAWASDSELTGLIPPHVVRSGAPDYANLPQLRSEVQVVLLIDETGRITDGMLYGLDNDTVVRAFTKALSYWRFSPAVKDGKAVPAVMSLTLSVGGFFRAPPRE